MKFSELYAQAIAAWPAEISIADAMEPSEKGSQYFPTLSKVSVSIEEQIDYKNQHWKNMGHWALFRAFHEEAQRLYLLGESTIKTRAVAHERINYWVLTNLQGEGGWEKELSEYEPLQPNPSFKRDA